MLYSLVKVKTLDSGEEYNENKMSGCPATAHVPTKEVREYLKEDNMEAINDIYKKDGFMALWDVQEKLEPVIGYVTYFISTSMDAGWFKTSPIQSYTTDEKGVITLTTLNSVYEARPYEQ